MDQSYNTGAILWIKLFKFEEKLPQSGRIRNLIVKKFLWRDCQVIADIEKCGHGGQSAVIFNTVDIGRPLSDCQAHFACGNALFQPERRQTMAKPFLIHTLFLL